MKEKERNEKYEKQTSELYASYGRFAVNFEQMCFRMRECILWCLDREGLKDQSLAEILMADLTADPIRVKLLSIFAQLYSEDEGAKRIVGVLLKKIQEIIKERNDMIHGVWFIGWASQDDTDFGEAGGVKQKAKKNGLKTETYRFEANDFDKLSDRIELIIKCLSRLSGCIAVGYNVETELSKIADIEKI